ncbi:MAG: hypothetical protein NTZ14_11190, partial [Hyphomicrobiales bacterium]|nr:hypothetical protein [Hyphomicrobiales bacterium]
WGETIAAVIVRRHGADVSEEEIVAFCKDQLAAFKVPRQVIYVDALPRNTAGKILKRELRSLVAGN